MPSSKPSTPKGMRDFGPEKSAKRSYIIDTIKRNFKKYGFSQISTPAMEQLSTLTGKYGDEGDQLLFKVLNSGDYLKKVKPEEIKDSSSLLPKIAEKGLRYDLTVPFARYVVQNQHELTYPFKRYQIQPVWRADRPQKGRYREFFQCDADIIGSDSLWNEAELALLVHDVYQDLGLASFILKINHREILYKMAAYVSLAGKEMPFCVAIDKLDKIGSEKVAAELKVLGANQSKVDEILSFFTKERANAETLRSLKSIIGNNKGLSEVEKFFSYLENFPEKDFKIQLDASLARGLSYYTGLIFEVKATDVQIGSITGGGRYDNLTGIFGLPDVSGVGISFGLDRIYDVLEEMNLFPENLTSKSTLLIAHFDEACFEHGLGLLSQLRQTSIIAEIFPDQVKIKKQFNYADKNQIPFVLIIGSEEIKAGSYTLKNMQTGEQKQLSIDKVIASLSANRIS